MLDRIANPPAGMLRRGSPVIVLLGGHRGLVESAAEEVAFWCGKLTAGLAYREATDLALDLCDATGCTHLAAWLNARHGDVLRAASRSMGLNPFARRDMLEKARALTDMTPTEIDTLARLALRVMGREP